MYLLNSFIVNTHYSSCAIALLSVPTQAITSGNYVLLLPLKMYKLGKFSVKYFLGTSTSTTSYIATSLSVENPDEETPTTKNNEELNTSKQNGTYFLYITGSKEYERKTIPSFKYSFALLLNTAIQISTCVILKIPSLPHTPFRRGVVAHISSAIKFFIPISRLTSRKLLLLRHVLKTSSKS